MDELLDREIKAIEDEIEQMLKSINDDIELTFNPSPQPDGRIIIGVNRDTGKLVYVNVTEFLEKHCHILGTTGMGKTYFLDYLIRTFIKLGHGICLIDPLGGLYQRMLKYVVRYRLEDRVILIDPNDEEWSVGLNLLEFDKNTTSASAHVEDVMKEIRLVKGEDEDAFMPQHDRWSYNVLDLLTEAGLSAYEMSYVADPHNAALRNRILQEAPIDVETRREWETQFENYTPADKMRIMESLKNRARPFSTPHGRRIFGQLKSTIDFKKAMDGGKIILVNLNAGAVSQESQKMLGVEVIYKLMRAARSRGTNRRPFHVFIDEFGELVNMQIVKALDTLRQFGVYFNLSHQRLEQLIPKDGNKNLYSAVMGSTRLKFSFRVTEPENARQMADILFAGELTGDKEKLVLKRRAFAPVTEWVDIESMTMSKSDGGSKGRGKGTGTGNSQQIRVGAGLVDLPGSVDSTSFQEHHSDTESQMWADSEARTVTTTPMTRHEEYEEISSVQHYTIEEIKQMCANQILMQDVQQMLFKSEISRPIPLTTPKVEDVRVREVDIERFKEKVYAKYARPSIEVDQELESRRNQLMGQEPYVEPLSQSDEEEEKDPISIDQRSPDINPFE